MSKVITTARATGVTPGQPTTEPANAGVLADPDVRVKARAALAGGCPAVEVAEVVGASVADVEQLATGNSDGWHACPSWCTGHDTGHGDVCEAGKDLHTGVTYTLDGVSTCRGGHGPVSVYVDRLDPVDQAVGDPVVWLSSHRSGECWELTAGQALRLAAMLILSARRAAEQCSRRDAAPAAGRADHGRACRGWAGPGRAVSS